METWASRKGDAKSDRQFMRVSVYAVLIAGTLLAAIGQVSLKLGATGRESLGSFLNVWILVGLTCYAVGTAFWVFALSKASLTVVYPFTALTFILVYLASILVLGEPTSPQQLFGVVLVLAGLYLIAVV